MKTNRILFLLLCLMALPLKAQELDLESRKAIARVVDSLVGAEIPGGGARLDSHTIRGRRLRLNFSLGLANYPFREPSVEMIYDSVRGRLPEKLEKYKLEIYTDKQLIEELIPLAERTKFDRRKILPFTNTARHPLVRSLSSPVVVENGLQNRHIALWQSHGFHFDQQDNRWEWQRTAQWMTREDLFTQSFVLPFLTPMLERAGANVLLPRERDLQPHEVLIDADLPESGYTEHCGQEPWREGGSGFAHPKSYYLEHENPFRMGGCRLTHTVMNPKMESRAEWRATLPEAGEYALYVSYRSMENSCEEALYTVHHAGGESRFAVNQRMGGGTWVYLGTFRFEEEVFITLSNLSNKAQQVVVADAIKVGGGMGNIARTPCDSLRREGVEYHPLLSGLPRYMEGSRYWLQWAGFDEKVYQGKGGMDDYKEDYMSRAHWVNALMGGSQRLPDSVGLKIPIDLALAFHTDSGMRDSDETIGTLGIFYTKENKGSFSGGASRYRSRDLTDLVMTEIVEDIQALWEPSWRRRGLWNKAYYEARIPAAPTMLLELLSHQNFADMRYGHDPSFKFMVSRAIYKGILKHVAAQYGYPYVVQPLPVRAFQITRQEGNRVELRWLERPDSLEPTAQADYFLLYTAIDGGDFDHGRKISGNSVVVEQEPGRHYRYRMTACNRGGESFPSETLAAFIHPEAKGEVMIVNGFTRVSAAPSFRTETEAGFVQDDCGVSYLRDISYIGAQQCYDRAMWQTNDPEQGVGGCLQDSEGVILAGNSFDYPALHGRAIAQAGYSYLSCSVEAFQEETFDTTRYEVVDLILGKQRSTLLAHGASGYQFSCFPRPLQEKLKHLTSNGVNLLVSGSYVGSDLWECEASTDADRAFAREVLHYEYLTGHATRLGRVRGFSPEIPIGSCHFNQAYGLATYAVESPDAIGAVGQGAFSMARYAENNRSAAVAYEGERYRSVVFGFPIESITSDNERNTLMKGVLNFLIEQ